MRAVSEAILQVMDTGGRAALATVVEAQGSTPQGPGARLLLDADGESVGTVGGGAVEAAVLDALAHCLDDRTARLVRWRLEPDLGMTCGGSMTVFVEPVEGLPRLVIFGAGHVARATAPLARTVGFRPTVVDDRPEFLTAERFPDCERVAAHPREAAPELDLGPRDWVLVLTRSHRSDAEALATVLPRHPRYVGLIGSRRKVDQLRRELEAGTPPVQHLDHLFAPVGLDIGATTPEELAVSLVAELLAVRHGRGGGHLTVSSEGAETP